MSTTSQQLQQLLPTIMADDDNIERKTKPTTGATAAQQTLLSNIKRWGAQPGCPACQQIVRDVKVTFAHTQAFRDRIKAERKCEGKLDWNITK
eukprot:4356235-Amphidinium_carterae.1